jgi:hypothetical protein
MEGYWYIPVKDIIFQHKLKITKIKNYNAFTCPCSNCRGGLQNSITKIKQHLQLVPSKGIWTPCADQMEEKEKNAAIDQNRNDFPNASTIHFLDLEHGISQQVFDSLHHADELFQEPLRDAKNTS